MCENNRAGFTVNFAICRVSLNFTAPVVILYLIMYAYLYIV